MAALSVLAPPELSWAWPRKGAFERATMKTAYDVLGVHRNASHETIRTAFRKAAKACHPDLNVSDPTAELQVRVVITAYEILKNQQKRAAYDRHFRERRSPVPLCRS